MNLIIIAGISKIEYVIPAFYTMYKFLSVKSLVIVHQQTNE